MKTIKEHLTSTWKTAESDMVMTNPAWRETEDELKEKFLGGDYGASD